MLSMFARYCISDTTRRESFSEAEEDIFREIDYLTGIREYNYNQNPDQDLSLLDYCMPGLTVESKATKRHIQAEAAACGNSSSSNLGVCGCRIS